MTDHYRVSANVTTKRGGAGEFAVCVSEGDTEVVPDEVKEVYLLSAIRRRRMLLAGPVQIEQANADGTVWTPNQGPHDAHYWAWRMKDYPRYDRPNSDIDNV